MGELARGGSVSVAVGFGLVSHDKYFFLDFVGFVLLSASKNI